MTQALVQLTENSNKILNMVKAKYDLKDKSQAVEIVITHYIECQGEPNFKEEFIERIKKAERGKFVKVKDFNKHFGVN